VAKGLTVRAYKPTNSVFIRYFTKDLERIKKLIEESLDVPVPQIQIAAQMVVTTLIALEQIGVQWGAAGAGKLPGTTVMVGQGFATPNQLNTGGQSILGGAITPVVPPSTVGNLVNLPTAFLPTTVGAAPAGGFLLGLIGSNFNLNLAIQALETQNKARTLAEPKAITMENLKATISRGFEVPYVSTPTTGVSQVQFKDALLKLEVTPRVIKEAGATKIRMRVNFENNNPDFTNTVAGNPSIFKRRQETEVLISEGQRLVIGGVTTDTRNSAFRQVPLFGNIPVLGWLFKSRETNSNSEELIVILTPTVISEAGTPPKR
jgi:type IV pilus assembly protein PilQ